MGIASRIAELYEAKVNALLDRAEDPREMIDYSYASQQECLRRMRDAAVDLAASRNRADTQEAQLRRTAERLRMQAQEAAEQAQLHADQERLAEATRRLEARVEALAYRKEAIKAAYTAAEARAAAETADLFSGAREAADAERRAAEQTAGLQARAEVLSEQPWEGLRQPLRSLSADRIQEQLDAVSRDAAVDEELARIKEQIGAGPSDAD
jgi:phage shock protein A